MFTSRALIELEVIPDAVYPETDDSFSDFRNWLKVLLRSFESESLSEDSKPDSEDDTDPADADVELLAAKLPNTP